MIKQYVNLALLALTVILATACGGEQKQEQAASQPATQAAHEQEISSLRIGVCPGPYGKMTEDAIAPYLAKKGITVEVVEFADYVQPNMALESGDIDANLFQNPNYLDSVLANLGLKIVPIINVPTLGLGIFSEVYTSFEQLKEGDKVAIPNDAVNLARALRIARDFGLITLKQESDDAKASLGDVDTNKYGIAFELIDAAQIARMLDSVALGFVPGNFAIAADLEYSKAVAIEEVGERIKNLIVVREGDKDTIGRILKEAVESDDFRQAIEGNDYYKGFTRPSWWDK